MIEFYPEIKFVHVMAVLLSGALFLTRWLLVQAGHTRPALAAPVRYLSYTIDTVLLTAALMLLTILPGAVFANGWLALKLGLLLLYIVLGVYALRRTTAPRRRALVGGAAITVFLAMIGIARAHHPLGWLLLSGMVQA